MLLVVRLVVRLRVGLRVGRRVGVAGRAELHRARARGPGSQGVEIRPVDLGQLEDQLRGARPFIESLEEQENADVVVQRQGERGEDVPDGDHDECVKVEWSSSCRVELFKRAILRIALRILHC